MERNDSILGGALLLTAANLLLRLISIAFQVFLSVRIGAAGLGLMQLISTIGVFAMLAGTAGVRVTAMYLAAEEFGHRRLSGRRAWPRARRSSAGGRSPPPPDTGPLRVPRPSRPAGQKRRWSR